MDKNQMLNEIEMEFEHILDSIFAHWTRKLISDEEMYRQRYINMKWFHKFYSYLEPAEEIDCSKLPKVLVDEYDTDKQFPLASIIFYHNETLPVYDDDYGQQVFARYNGKDWSGGAYNLDYLDTFTAQLDSTLEQQAWDTLLEMHKNRGE